jgi:outer membrane protein OmpA-like peptidoglycan-associated protein
MLKPSVLLVSALVPLALAGCMTKRVKLEPSAAVLQARAHAEQQKVHPTPLCASVTLDPKAPVIAPFGYEKTEVSESGAEVLKQAADWLTCHPANYAAVIGEADPTGTAERQKQVAAVRVKAVKAYLTARGVSPGRLLDYQPASGGSLLTITARGRGW